MLAMRTKNIELVVIADLGMRNEQLPIATAAHAHRMAPRVPEVEITDHADALGIGREHDEADTFGAVDRHRMRAELVVQPQVVAFAEQVKVVIAQDRQEAVGIVEIDDMIAEMRAQAVALQAAGQGTGEQAGIVDAPHRRDATAFADRLDARCFRQEGADHGVVVAVGMLAEIAKRVGVPTFDDRKRLGRKLGHEDSLAGAPLPKFAHIRSVLPCEPRKRERIYYVSAALSLKFL